MVTESGGKRGGTIVTGNGRGKWDFGDWEWSRKGTMVTGSKEGGGTMVTDIDSCN